MTFLRADHNGPMKLSLPPSGTRGVELPRLVRPILRAMMSVGTPLFRLGIKVQGRPLLRLGTLGARTGERRTTILSWFPSDGEAAESWTVVASNGGSARHPDWAHNLAHHPEEATVDIREGPVAVTAELLTGPEREEMWRRVVEMAPVYRRYEDKTDREIPIFRLTRRH